jgi:hypothetical protein
MRHCEIGNNAVDCSTVTVDSHSFGKTLAQQHAIPYRLTIDFTEVAKNFSSFYQSFVEREAEDEGFEESLEGDYLRLREAGYLPFERMLVEQPELLSRVLLKLLPSEFMGYLFRQDGPASKPAFALQTLTNIEIGNGQITCMGESFAIAK